MTGKIADGILLIEAQKGVSTLYIAMTNTRQQVMDNLLNRQRCTINELAEAVDINPISVRHHIGKLEADGLVNSEEERHGVGRPRRIYFLTEQGMEAFPSRTIRLTKQLLSQMKEDLPEETVNELFAGMASELSKNYRDKVDLKELNLDQRLQLIDEWLTNEGFSVQIERDDQQITIRETGCPYYHVGQSHSEVCKIDKALISEVLAASPERTTCLLNGDSHCTYVVPMDAIAVAQ